MDACYASGACMYFTVCVCISSNVWEMSVPVSDMHSSILLQINL